MPVLTIKATGLKYRKCEFSILIPCGYSDHKVVISQTLMIASPKLDDPAAECPETALLPTTGASDQYLAGWVQHYPKDGYEQQQRVAPWRITSENLTGEPPVAVPIVIT